MFYTSAKKFKFSEKKLDGIENLSRKRFKNNTEQIQDQQVLPPEQTGAGTPIAFHFPSRATGRLFTINFNILILLVEIENVHRKL